MATLETDSTLIHSIEALTTAIHRRNVALGFASPDHYTLTDGLDVTRGCIETPQRIRKRDVSLNVDTGRKLT